MKLAYFPLISQLIIRVTEVCGITCYCTENHCNLGICDGKVCVVGVKSKGLVSRRCGEEQNQKQQNGENNSDDSHEGKCVQNTPDWSEVCYCSTSYCNTLKFLLDGMQDIKNSKNNNDNEQHQNQDVSFGSSSNLDLKEMQTLLGKPYKLTDEYHDSLIDFSSSNLKNNLPVIDNVKDRNHRLESDFYDEFLTGGGEQRKDETNDNSAITITRQQPKLPKKNARHSMTNGRKDYSLITLVIVSLVIIAIAITLVTLNYYCKLC